MAEARLSALSIVGNPHGAWVLGVTGKRTYTVQGGACVEAPEQVAIVEEPQIADDASEVIHDSDLLLNRTQTDVIVQGHTYFPPGLAEFDVRLRVGDLDRRLRVFGNRGCELDAGGRVRFTPPKSMEKVSLDWKSAYGGTDDVAKKKFGDFTEDVAKEIRRPYDPRFGLYGYPRNPLGKGYLIEPTPEAVAACALPNLEDPAHLLTPQNLPLGKFIFWPKAAPVACPGWLSYNYFPRMIQAGIPPIAFDLEQCPPEQFPEVKAGLLRPEALRYETTVPQRLDIRVAQCAAVGMRVDAVAAGAPVELTNVHPKAPTWRFTLPGEVPRMALRLPGEKPVELAPKIRTILLEPDKDRLCLVWVAEHPLSLPVGPGKLAKTEHAVMWRT